MGNRQSVPIISYASAALLLLCSACAPQGPVLADRCRLEPINGPCKAMMERYRFDQKSGTCREYIYDGCGAVVPFESLEECRQLCEPPASGEAQGKMPGVEPAAEKPSGLLRDPVEDDPRHAVVFRNIDDEVKALLADHPRRGSEGFVNIYWETKKRLLKNRYGIDWRSPGEMNPQVIFD